MSADDERPFLEALSRRFPNRDSALAEIAHLEAVLTLPKGTVHVVSDVHGEHKKLSHVIRNASGSLRVLVDALFREVDQDERSLILKTVYYCDATWTHLGLTRADAAAQRAFVLTMVPRLAQLCQALAQTWSDRAFDRVLPTASRALLKELVQVSTGARPDPEHRYRDALIGPFLACGRGLDLLRQLARIVRNLSVYELIVAGDLGDRGPRLDKVIETLARQPRVAIAWGNHDVSWMGACLGHQALIATILRISLRYGRIQQLEEGYGISLEPLLALARTEYADDAVHPTWHGKAAVAGRDADTIARMHKAIAVMQWKLEGQVIARNPHFAMEHRRLLRRIRLDERSIDVDGRQYPLVDATLPTLDPHDPERLSAAEQRCIDALQASFQTSPVLWRHMDFIRRRGAMVLRRDGAVIFHGCVPMDDEGEYVPVSVDGAELFGPTVLTACEHIVHRAFRERRQSDVDWLWYLWTGPRSPLFGKDKMTTLESHLVDDASLKRETKGAYFRLVHEVDVCERLLLDFGVDPREGLLVNGHVPVRLEDGESPLKRSGKAITIDGAFSEAYGDRGFTLILEAGRTALAEHHHFESVDRAVAEGADIVPRVHDLRVHTPLRRVGDTETGVAVRREIATLWKLVAAFEDNRLAEVEATS